MGQNLATEIQCPDPPEYIYKMSDTVLEQTTVEKDLGVNIDNGLRMRVQAESAVNKANRIVGLIQGLIRRSYTHLDRPNWMQLFKSLVPRPHLEYEHVIWPLTYTTDLTLVENVQRRATKLVPGLCDRVYPERLQRLVLPSITGFAYRRSRGDIVEVFKHLQGHYSTNQDLLEVINTTVNPLMFASL